jgi:hypothetical protein
MPPNRSDLGALTGAAEAGIECSEQPLDTTNSGVAPAATPAISTEILKRINAVRSATLSWCNFVIKPKDRGRPLYRNQLICVGEISSPLSGRRQFAVFYGEDGKLFAATPLRCQKFGRSHWSVYEPKPAANSDALIDLVRRAHPRRFAALGTRPKPRRCEEKIE